jgi:hypothetical protein
VDEDDAATLEPPRKSAEEELAQRSPTLLYVCDRLDVEVGVGDASAWTEFVSQQELVGSSPLLDRAAVASRGAEALADENGRSHIHHQLGWASVVQSYPEEPPEMHEGLVVLGCVADGVTADVHDSLRWHVGSVDAGRAPRD